MAAAAEPEAEALAMKDVGNQKFKAGEYAAAVEAYTKSIELGCPQPHLCYSNRSAAYLKLGSSGEEALNDATMCIQLLPTFAKGYSRQAAALQELERWDEAVASCERGLSEAPDDGLSKMLVEVQTRRFSARLRGMWHGTVSEVMGGYEQEMEFLNETSVRVQVMGRSIVGRYKLNCEKDPVHLDIQVPAQEMGLGPEYPQIAPPVPYIVRIHDDDGSLQICCPYLEMERPARFGGPGFCSMVPGPLPKQDNSEVENLSREEKLPKCARELLAALPERKLEETSETDSQEAQGEKIMAQVRFETAMFQVQNRFGEDIMKEVLSSTKTRGGEVAPELAGTKELRELRAKLKTCGLLDEEEAAAAPSSREAATARADSSPPPPPVEPPSSKKENGVPAPPLSEKEELTKPQMSNLRTFGLVALGTASVAVLAFVLWRRQRR